MAGLLDFLQAASNAAASNVSGPVDGINWLLKKVGVPVSDAPVGGSQWMQNKGLTRPVQQGAAQVAGETVGLLSPFMAAQYAPQIAKGLLQAGENMAAPATMNRQRGAIVWHGSPHKFDKFDSSKIGTGEGAQAAGHGLYVSDAADVAKTYMPRTTSFEDKFIAPAIEKAGGDIDKAIASAKSQAIKQRLLEWKRQGLPGSLYKVELPDEAIGKMLDLDKPLSSQPSLFKKLRELGYKFDPEDTGTDVARILEFQHGGDPQASAWLRSQGVPGLRYADKRYGDGISNYVVFPGEEGLLSILERNGMPLR